MAPVLPIPDFQDSAQNTLRDEIFDIIEKIKIKYDQNIVGMVSFVPIFFDWGSIIQYKPNDRTTVLRSIKTNIANILKQVDSSLEKMDAINKPNIHLFLTRIVIQNVPGKSSTSKKSTFYEDGTLEIQTVFEDSLNCQYYLEKKILTNLNEFRPKPGAAIPEKVAAPSTESQPVISSAPVAAAPQPLATPSSFNQSPIASSASPVISSTPALVIPTAPSAASIDLSIPTYQNGAWESLKIDIIAACKPMKIDNTVLPGPPFDLPVSVDWSSIPVSGQDYNIVLRSMKTNIPNICKQILPGIQKLEDFRKPMIADYMVSVVFQNVAGKASTSKKVFLSAEGSLMVQVPFEDALNCSYYFEKKVTSGLQEFAPPSNGSAPQPKIVSPIEQVPQQPQQSPAAVPQQTSQPTYSIPTSYQAKPVAQVQTYVPHYASQPQPEPVVVAPPQPVVVAPIVREPPKPKGRQEMEFKPTIEEFNTQFLLREIDYFISQVKVVNEKDEEFGVPIYVDWASIMVYPSPVKQNTIIRNVNLSIYRILRDVTIAIKMACTDFANKDNIIEYLRSVTIQNAQGTSSSLKKVTYEDGHLTVQTIFEDFGNCGLYLDSKVIQALQSRPSTPTPKKPEAVVIIKEEVNIRLNAHKNTANKDGMVFTPSCDTSIDWSTFSVKAYEGQNLENNVISLTNQIFIDFFQAILSFSPKEIEILLKEITKVNIAQALPGKTIFDKRSVAMLDNGVLNMVTTFEDRNEGFKTFKEKFTNCLKARLFKVEIRDTLVPAIKEMIDTAVKINYKPNYLDNIPVTPFDSYSSTVIFDWQLIDKELLENQVKMYSDIVKNLSIGATFTKVLDGSIRNICSYDVGKNAFLECNQFILRSILKHKEEIIRNTGPNTWEFYITYHDASNYHFNQNNLTTLFKETLKVAFPCAIQDTFPRVDNIVEELEAATGKRVPVVVNYDSWRNVPAFRDDSTSYKSIDDIAVKITSKGLDCVRSLCKDPIVKAEYTKKVNKIIINCDPENGVVAARSKDPDTVGKLLNNELSFTLNFKDAKYNKTSPWDYQFELMLQTRPLKIQRAIEKAKGSLEEVTRAFSGLIGKQVPVSVDYQGFINDDFFIVNLEEEVYTKVIASFAHLVQKGWIDSAPCAELLTYETLKKSIQSQMNSLKFVISCASRQRENYEFSFNGNELVVGLNLTSACKVELKEWRLDIERLFKLRDLRIREEIAKRIDYTPGKNAISATVGKPIDLVVDFESIIVHPDFNLNNINYCEYLHVFSEQVSMELSKGYAFGRVVEYSEVKSYVQSNLSKVIIVAGSVPNGMDITYDKSSKTIKVIVGIKVLLSKIKENVGNYEMIGRKIERAMDLRLMIVKGYITRNEPQSLEEAKSRLLEAVELDVNISIDWSKIIEHGAFLNVVEYFPVIKNMISLYTQIHPLVKLCRENFAAKDALRAVRNYTIVVDGNDRINESEFDQNKFGVDWAKASWMNPPSRDHILITVNLGPIIKNTPHDLEIEDKIEFLVTPDKALERYNRKVDLQQREQDRWAAERRHNEQMAMDRRMASAADERNRELDRLNRNLSRRW